MGNNQTTAMGNAVGTALGPCDGEKLGCMSYAEVVVERAGDRGDPTYLIIEDIGTASLISEWNSIHDASECVQVGDAVTSVNGLSGNAQDMQEQLIILSRSHEKEDLHMDIRPNSMVMSQPTANKSGARSGVAAGGREQLITSESGMPIEMTLQNCGGGKAATAEPRPSNTTTSTAAPSVSTTRSVATPDDENSNVGSNFGLPTRSQGAPQPKRKADNGFLLRDIQDHSLT